MLLLSCLTLVSSEYMMNAEDGDASMFFSRLNMMNMIHNEKNDLGQQSWHHSSEEQFSSSSSIHLNQLSNSNVATRWPMEKDLFNHKRFSISLGGPSEHVTSLFTSEFPNRKDSISIKKKPFNQLDNAEPTQRKKRRLSNLGCLTASFFEDYAKAARRGSMTSLPSFAASNHGSNKSDQEDDDESVISQMSDGVEFYNNSNYLFQTTVRQKASQMSMKQVIEDFHDAMMMSQMSQQAIHDWDKKMGLKRSHSKTMRLTMRSRKKVKNMIKRDMLNLGSEP